MSARAPQKLSEANEMMLLMQRLRTLQLRLGAVDPVANQKAEERLLTWRAFLGEMKMKDPGIRHLAIDVDDFDAAHAHLKSLGVKFLGEPFVNQGNRLVFFADCEDNILHLITRETPLP